MPRKPPIPGRRALPAVFTYGSAIAAGISAERLYAYRDQGLLEQIGRGLYRWSDEGEFDADLLEIAYRVPRATLCLDTALARHGLTDAIPHRTDVAIPRGRRIPVLRTPVDIHSFAGNTFEIGREEIAVDNGLSIGIYSAERSIIDVIRLRHREGTAVAWEALRRWLRRRGSQPGALLDLATRFHGVEPVVRQALEIIL